MAINLVQEKTTKQMHVFLFWIIKFLKGFGNDLVTGVIFIDLQKAFDRVHHDILLKKWSIIGFCDHNVKWSQFYRSNNKFAANLRVPFLKFQAYQVVCQKDKFLALYYYWYTLMICQWQLNVICTYMLVTHA